MENEIMYGGPDDDLLHHDSKDEYIEEVFEGSEGFAPKTITVCAYRRKVIGGKEQKALSAYIIEALLEKMDDEYGNPVDCTDPSDEQKKLAAEFVAGVVSCYRVWQYDKIATEEVDVRDWLRQRENASGIGKEN